MHKREPFTPLYVLNSHLHPLLLNYVPADYKEYHQEQNIQHRLRFPTPTEGERLNYITSFQRQERGFECGSACGEASLGAVVC